MSVGAAAAPLELWMPVWTPGAYELRTWGRNLTPLDAHDASGRALELTRVGPSRFRVRGHAAGAAVTVRYRVYAAHLSDDGSQVDAGHALLNGSSLFLAARGQERGRHRVAVVPPAGWRVASALDAGDGGFVAAGYEALIDAPIECGHFASLSLRAAGRVVDVAVDGVGAVPARLGADVARLLESEAHLVGPPPFARYLVLIHLDDGYGKVAALEHAAATSIIVPARSLAEPLDRDDYDELRYVIAHELFHAWDARPLRPAELVPYDLERPQTSRALWITEGLAEYYAHRVMRLGGFWSRAAYLERLGEEAARAREAAARGPALAAASELAWAPPDAAGDDLDAYYARGHLMALGLDAELRATSDGRRSLDDVVRALGAAAARAPGGVLALDAARLGRAAAQVEPRAQAALAALLGAADAGDESAALDAPLARLGLALVVTPPPARVEAGFRAARAPGGLRVGAVAPASAAAEAGLLAGDLVTLVDGAAATPRGLGALATRPPGTLVRLAVLRAGRRLGLRLALRAVTTPLVRVEARADADARTERLRAAWLGAP